MSEIEWSPWIERDDQSRECPSEAAALRCGIRMADGDEYGETGLSVGDSWEWLGVTHYCIPMSDYKRIYGDPLDSHPNSEPDADGCSVVADTLEYDPVDVAFDVCEKRGLDPYDAASFLDAALGHMRDREATYDAPCGERSMGKTVAAFNAVTGHSLTEEQGWLFMVLLKAVRTQQGGFRADNYEDGAAYFGLQGEAAHRERG